VPRRERSTTRAPTSLLKHVLMHIHSYFASNWVNLANGTLIPGGCLSLLVTIAYLEVRTLCIMRQPQKGHRSIASMRRVILRLQSPQLYVVSPMVAWGWGWGWGCSRGGAGGLGSSPAATAGALVELEAVEVSPGMGGI